MNEANLFSNAFNFAVNCAASGDNTIYVVPAGKKIVVYYLFIQSEADVSATLKSASTVLTGVMDFWAANALERTFACSGVPVFKTITAGDDLILNLSGAVQMNGFGTAIEVHA